MATTGAPDTAAPERQRLSARDFSDKISYAFQLATAQGPLCNEPIQGIAVFVEDMAASTIGWEELGRLTGEVIRSVRDAVWQGFLDWSPRILLAMYSCEIQASSKYNNSSTSPNPATFGGGDTRVKTACHDNSCSTFITCPPLC